MRGLNNCLSSIRCIVFLSVEYCVAFVPTKFLSHFQGVKFTKSCSQRDSKSNSWATELCVMIQLQPSHIASLWKLCVGSDNLKTVEVEVAYKDGHVDVS